MSKLNLSVSQRQEHSHLVLSVCSQPAAGCLIPNLCMEGFRKTTCCVSVHQNQHSHHSVNACQRRTKANAHKHHTLLIVQLFIILGSGFTWGFWRLPHPEKDSGADFALTEVLSTSQTSGFLYLPVFWNKQDSWNPMSQAMWTFGVCFHWCSIDFTRINVNITLACNC